MTRAATIAALIMSGVAATVAVALTGRELAVRDYARQLNRDVRDRIDDRRPA